ncbi:MAG TPA: nucleoside phosphorylase [Nitrososphaerales archaeon]|nr:nucleoside phosphorylase [Nitrososphaerales archaeon]
MAHEPKDRGGRPYHVRLSKDDVGRVALLPGDPGRVPLIAERLSNSKPLGSNREYTAYGGKAGGEKVVVVSTGIGGPAAAIAVEELARLGVKAMIRVGTCGAIQPYIKVGSLVIADAAVRMDGTSAQYVRAGYPAAATPGVVMALSDAAAELGKAASVGIAASTDSFYVGQGRSAFGGYMPSKMANVVDEMRAAKVLCFEMEAATLFTLGRIFAIKTGAVLAAVANRITDDFRPEAGVDDAIDVAVAAVKTLKSHAV